jgi:NAD(P)-dependent dehydrogenase (short-subunit alcohol dehydrogenase family)
MSLEGKVVLVTGGGQGIGEACAWRLGREGARVAVAARGRDRIDQVAGALAAAGVEALAVPCDVGDPAQVTAMVDRVVEAWGRVDVLVCNAGTAASAPLLKTDDALWDRTLATNLSGTFYCMRAVLAGMLARGWGRIINIASVAGKVGFQYTSAYCASKHGVVGLTRAVALEVAKKGVTVNAICPGFVDTPMTDLSVDNIVSATGRDAASARGYLESLSPQGRLMTAQEVAELAWYLTTDAARGIHGQAIPLDGGGVQS